MSDKKKKINEIFESDEFKLLQIETSKGSNKSEEDDRLIDSFHEISAFFEKYKRSPGKNGILEFKLFSRLESIKSSPIKVKKLLPFDYYNLLDKEATKSIEPLELIQDDPFGILDDFDEDTSIYEMKHVAKSDRISPDYLAKRKVCQNFEDFKVLFDHIHKDLEDNKRHLIRFEPNSLKPGNFYVLNGILLLLDELDVDLSTVKFKSGDRDRMDGRTRCVFDNGTESDMLFRSLIKALQLDGFRVSDPIIKTNINEIVDEDQINGFIYVLKSKSLNPSIYNFQNLYKIGYSKGDVTKRIKNAIYEPTYLMSEVELVSVFRCFNMNISKFENKIHSFFNEVRLAIEVFDANGKLYKPREWFDIPYHIIEQVIELFIENRIDNYYYDHTIEKIIKKSNSL